MKKEEKRLEKYRGILILSSRKVDEAVDLLSQRKEYLQKAVSLKEKQLKKFPEGTLRISRSENRVQYYRITEPGDRRGVYIPQSNMKLVHQLAQKTEDQKELAAIKKELAHINKFISKYPRRAESVYEALSEERKKLVLPLEEPFEEFAKRWLAQEFVPHPVPPGEDGLVTDRGDIVRSRAELITINMAIQMGIPNHYEKPLYLEGEGTVYPDMTGLSLDRVEKYVEYFGGMNDPEYAARAVHKINSYERNGIYLGERLIAIFEAEGEPLDTRHVRDLLKRHFL